jgi:iron complex outermembrane receptor protein
MMMTMSMTDLPVSLQAFPGALMRLTQAAAALTVLTGMFVPAPAEAQQAQAQDLRRLSLEELMQIEVTLVTRQPEPVGTAAAAISVITRDDIRRSGVTTIADAIALADGMNVARFNNGTWAITARGFNANTANKLLVMVDGRTEFSPLFAGVFWNIVDYVLDDIERIEVIRGPGATLWGANAVNGVVNIVTRNARDTRGTLLAFTSGNEDPAIAETRYGGGSEALSYRVYGKFARRNAQRVATGASAEDTRRRGQAGFRLDGERGASEVMIKADVFHSRDELIDRRSGEWTAMSAQARLHRQLAAGSSLQVQSYYRREYRNVERQLTHELDTVDVDFQHSVRAGAHQFIWGAAARANWDKTFGSAVFRFEPANRSYPLFSAFVQDELTATPSVSITGGLKLEHNAFSGANWQPNLRGRWIVRPEHVLWGSVAHAVRRPTRFEDEVVVTDPSGLVLVRGTGEFEPELMTGAELGYRGRPVGALTVDVVGFVQSYDRLRSQDSPVGGLIPATVGNTLNGRSRGVEIGVTAEPVDRWRLHAGFTRLATDITADADSRDVTGGVSESNDPSYWVTVRSGTDLPHNTQLDLWLRRIGSLPDPAVPAYTELNARLGWQPNSRVELALVGQDLLNDRHPEFGTAAPQRIEFERSVRAVLTIRMP